MQEQDVENRFQLSKEPYSSKNHENEATEMPVERKILGELGNQKQPSASDDSPCQKSHMDCTHVHKPIHHGDAGAGWDHGGSSSDCLSGMRPSLVPNDCFRVPLKFCEEDDDDEVFFGPVTEKERRRAQKFASRKTIVFKPEFRKDKRASSRIFHPNDSRLQGIEEMNEGCPGVVEKSGDFPKPNGRVTHSGASRDDSVGSVNITLAKYSIEGGSAVTPNSASWDVPSMPSGMVTDCAVAEGKWEVAEYDSSLCRPSVEVRKSEYSLDSLNISYDSLEPCKVANHLAECNNDMPDSDQMRPHSEATRRESQYQVEEYLDSIEKTPLSSSSSSGNISARISIEDACDALLSLQIAGPNLTAPSVVPSEAAVTASPAGKLEEKISCGVTPVQYSSDSTSTADLSTGSSSEFLGESATSVSSYISTSESPSTSESQDLDESLSLIRRRLVLGPSPSGTGGQGPGSKDVDSEDSSIQSYNGQISDIVDRESEEISSIPMISEDKASPGVHNDGETVPHLERNECKNRQDGSEESDKMTPAKRGLPAYLELLKVEDITVDSEILENDLDDGHDLNQPAECDVGGESGTKLEERKGSMPPEQGVDEPIGTRQAGENETGSSMDDSVSDDSLDSSHHSLFTDMTDSSQDEVIFHGFGRRRLETCIEEDEEEMEFGCGSVGREDICRDQSMVPSIDDSLESSQDDSMSSGQQSGPETEVDQQKSAFIQNDVKTLESYDHVENKGGKESHSVREETAHDLHVTECETQVISEGLSTDCRTPSQPPPVPSLSHTLSGTIALCNGLHSAEHFMSPTPAVTLGSCTSSSTDVKSVPLSTLNVSDVISDSDCELFEEDKLDVHESLYSNVKCPRASGEISCTSLVSAASNGFPSVHIKKEPVEGDGDFIQANESGGSPEAKDASLIQVKSEPVSLGSQTSDFAMKTTSEEPEGAGDQEMSSDPKLCSKSLEISESLTSENSPISTSPGPLSYSSSNSPKGWFFPPPSLSSMASMPQTFLEKPRVKEESGTGFFSFVNQNECVSSPLFIKQEPESDSENGDGYEKHLSGFPDRGVVTDMNDEDKCTPFITSIEDEQSHGYCSQLEDKPCVKVESAMKSIPPVLTPVKSTCDKHVDVLTSNNTCSHDMTIDIDEVTATEPDGYLSLVSRAEILGATDRDCDVLSVTETSEEEPDAGQTLEDKLRHLKQLQDEKMKLKAKIENSRSSSCKKENGTFKVPNGSPPRSAHKNPSHPVLNLTPKHLSKMTKENTKANGLPRVRLRLQTPGLNTVVRHSPAVKPASKVQWTEALVVQPEYHTPSKAGSSSKPILIQRSDHVFPYQDDTPSPVGFSRLTRSRTLGRKSLEARYAKLLVKEEKDREALVKSASRGRSKRGRGRGVKKTPVKNWSQASPRVDTGLAGRRNQRGGRGGVKMELESPGRVTPLKCDKN